MRFARPWVRSFSRRCSKVAGLPVTVALCTSPPPKRTFARSLATPDSGILICTLPVNSQRLSSKPSPLATARSAVMRTSPWTIITLLKMNRPFCVSKSVDSASSLIGSWLRSGVCAAAAPAVAASRMAMPDLRSEQAIDAGFQMQAAFLEVGAHAGRMHAMRAEGEFHRALCLCGLGIGVELQPGSAQFRLARAGAGRAVQLYVALEFDHVPAGGYARFARSQVPAPAIGGVVVDRDVRETHDAVRRVFVRRFRFQADAKLPVRTELLEHHARQEIAGPQHLFRRRRRLAIEQAPLHQHGDQRGERGEQQEPRRHWAARAATSQSQNSRTAPRPPLARVTYRAAASTSGCASATAAGSPTAAINSRSGVSSTRQATRFASIALRFSSSASARALSFTPWATSLTPSSRMRAVTAPERRPEMTATPMPAAIRFLMPWPTRTSNTLSDSPSEPYQRRPSVSTPSTSSTTRETCDGGVT